MATDQVNITLNTDRLSVFIDQKEVRLTSKEFDILCFLLKASGKSASRSEFFDGLWNGLKVCNKVLDVHVSNLRKKVRLHGIKIQFVKPSSFMVVLPSPPGMPAERQNIEAEKTLAS